MKGYTIGRKIKRQSKFEDIVVGKFTASSKAKKKAKLKVAQIVEKSWGQ